MSKKNSDFTGTMTNEDWSPEGQEALDYVNATDETETEETNALPDNSPMPESLINYALLVASRESNVAYEIGQAGNKEFGFADVIAIAYRLEVALSDKEIKAIVRKGLRSGLIEKGAIRGKFVAGRMMRMTHADLIAEFNVLRERRNPTVR